MIITFDTDKETTIMSSRKPTTLEDIYTLQRLIDDLLCALIEEEQKRNIVTSSNKIIPINK